MSHPHSRASAASTASTASGRSGSPSKGTETGKSAAEQPAASEHAPIQAEANHVLPSEGVDAPLRQRMRPLTVRPEEAGQKLLQFLLRRFDGRVPGSALLRAIRTGQVRVDGGRKKPFFRLSAGQEVRVPPLDVPRSDAAASSDERDAPASDAATPGLDILFENDGCVAVRKPAGLCSHAGTRHRDSVADRLRVMYAGAAFVPVLTHRLDKDTSGILLAAKTYAELRRLNELFATRGVRKTYLAWVDGVWPHEEPLLMEDELARLDLADGATDRRKTRRAAEGDAGKPARAEARPLLRKRSATLLLVRLLTGRTHQIRAQLSLRGYPVISDAVYGRKVRGVPMLLHALCLRLPEGALFAEPDWTGPFALPGKLAASLRAELAPMGPPSEGMPPSKSTART